MKNLIHAENSSVCPSGGHSDAVTEKAGNSWKLDKFFIEDLVFRIGNALENILVKDVAAKK